MSDATVGGLSGFGSVGGRTRLVCNCSSLLWLWETCGRGKCGVGRPAHNSFDFGGLHTFLEVREPQT